jgi:hypothetical protein
MVGYAEATTEEVQNHGYQVVLTDFVHYGPGEARTMPAFLEHTKIDVENFKCGHIEWCNKCTLD